MKPRMKVTGMSAVRTELRVYADRVPDTARKTMHRSAAQIVKMAKEYSPEDESNLVRGIQIIKDYAGQNGRLQIDVGIIMPPDAFSASGTPLTSAQFDNYATLVHENYEYVARVNGPSAKTIAKMAEHGEKVGSGFLRTAAKEEEHKLDKKMIDAITKVIEEVSSV